MLIYLPILGLHISQYKHTSQYIPEGIKSGDLVIIDMVVLNIAEVVKK